MEAQFSQDFILSHIDMKRTSPQAGVIQYILIGIINPCMLWLPLDNSARHDVTYKSLSKADGIQRKSS